MDYIQIRTCPTARHELKTKGICQLKYKCQKLDTLKYGKQTWNAKKQMDCECPLIYHEYKCIGTKYCTKDKFTCDQIINQNLNNKTQIRAKYCSVANNKKNIKKAKDLRDHFKNIF